MCFDDIFLKRLADVGIDKTTACKLFYVRKINDVDVDDIYNLDRLIELLSDGIYSTVSFDEKDLSDVYTRPRSVIDSDVYDFCQRHDIDYYRRCTAYSDSLSFYGFCPCYRCFIDENHLHREASIPTTMELNELDEDMFRCRLDSAIEMILRCQN